jgi:hypothetical protein
MATVLKLLKQQHKERTMSIPYNPNLALSSFQSGSTWYQNQEAPLSHTENQANRAADELYDQTFKQQFARGIQFIRDAARLVLKVPIRAITTPIFLQKNWRERERATVNTKLAGYAFIQLVSVPAKFSVALAALAVSQHSQEKAQWLLDKSEGWTAYLDGRASQLEALKEEGAKKARDRQEFENYKAYLYKIDPIRCRGELNTKHHLFEY